MSPAPRTPSSRRASSVARPPSAAPAKPAAKPAARPASRVAAKPAVKQPAKPVRVATPDEDGLDPQDPDEGQTSAPARRPSSTRVARTAEPAKSSRMLYVVIALGVVVATAGAAYRPVMRSVKLGTLDKAEGAAALEAADDYVRFESGSEAYVREVIRANRGAFAAQVRMATVVKSFPALMNIVDRDGLDAAQRAEALTAAASVFIPERHRDDRLPKAVAEWAESHEDRAVAIAAMAVLTLHGGANHDPDTPALLARIAAKPAQDPLRVAAALDGLAAIVDQDSLGQAIGLLHSNASDQVLAHKDLPDHIRVQAQPGNLAALVDLLDHPTPGVRALALDAIGGLRLPESDSQQRQSVGERIAAKLVPATPPVELAAALKATSTLRLTGARDAVLALLPKRGEFMLPDLDDAWWADCLGRAFVLTQPDAARPVSEDQIGKLAAALANPASRSVAAKALSLVGDRNFAALRKALDTLAEQDDPACVAALGTLVRKTYDSAEVATSCGSDVKRWRAFLATDRPNSLRAAEIRAYVDTHQDMQHVSKGRAALKETQAWLEKAGADLQGWCDDAKFVPPLGMTRGQVENLLHDVKTLHFGVNKAMPGA